MPLPTLNLLVGGLLAGLGVSSFLGTGAKSRTALIPAGLGVLLVGCGLLGRRGGDVRRHAMHVSSLVALAGVAGSARAVPGLVTLARDGKAERPAALAAQTATLGLCGLLVGLSTRSFVERRRKRATV